jgi:hypothetical protein
MHIENLTGFVQCTERIPGTQSSRWFVEDAGDSFVRLKSDLNPLVYIHVENLQTYAQYGNIESSWWSAMWALEPEIITSVNELSVIKRAEIFPNPSNGNFTLELKQFAQNEKVLVSIFNENGGKVYSQNHSVDGNGLANVKISLSNMLSDGCYFITATGEYGVACAKILIGK